MPSEEYAYFRVMQKGSKEFFKEEEYRTINDRICVKAYSAVTEERKLEKRKEEKRERRRK